MTAGPPDDHVRRDELAEHLDDVRHQIDAAAASVGRRPEEVTLVVVTKTFPVSDIRLLSELGVRDVAENRHPEAGEKAAELADLGLTWHFIGQLQTNKAARVAQYADVVHSVDSERLVRRLGTGAHSAGRVVSCLVQVSLDPPGDGSGRGGAQPGDVTHLADVIAATEGLRLAGVMGVAPAGGSAADAFARLSQTAADLRAQQPSATMISAGMSHDFGDAVRAGATHVRVGSAILGHRPPLG